MAKKTPTGTELRRAQGICNPFALSETYTENLLIKQQNRSRNRAKTLKGEMYEHERKKRNNTSGTY
jgi:hypothetical protein